MELRDGSGARGRFRQKRQIYVESLGRAKGITIGRRRSTQLGVGCSREAPEDQPYSIGTMAAGMRRGVEGTFAVHSKRRGRGVVRWGRARREGREAVKGGLGTEGKREGSLCDEGRGQGELL